MKAVPNEMRRRILADCNDGVSEVAAATPDAILEEIRVQLPVVVTTLTVFNELRRLKLVYKKQLHAAEQDRRDVVQKRSEWKLIQVGLNPKKSVFLDAVLVGCNFSVATSAKTNMTRLYSRAEVGKRLVDKTPHGHWVNTTYVCGLKHDGIVAPYAFTGAMNNLSAHKGEEVETLISLKGAKVLYLPAYSPDLNPIELSFSKLKSVLRKLKIRDVGKLQRFLQRSPKLFSHTECKNYFRHAGYTVK